MKKILVCHTGAWIGDMVLLTPTLCAIKQSFPNSHLAMLLILEVIHYLSVVSLLQDLSPQISAFTTTSNLEYWYIHDDRIAIK